MRQSLFVHKGSFSGHRPFLITARDRTQNPRPKEQGGGQPKSLMSTKTRLSLHVSVEILNALVNQPECQAHEDIARMPFITEFGCWCAEGNFTGCLLGSPDREEGHTDGLVERLQVRQEIVLIARDIDLLGQRLG